MVRHVERATNRKTMQSIINARIGKLVVTDYVDKTFVRCRCDCGNDCVVRKTAFYSDTPRLTCGVCESSYAFRLRIRADELDHGGQTG